MRILTGPRWRLGGRDISALWRRAVELDDPGAARPATSGIGQPQGSDTEQIVAQAAPDADRACLADAICDPGPAASYSPVGHARIIALGDELTALRAHLAHPLPDLVAEIRRVLGIDTEVRAARRWAGTEHLDRFADVVAGFANRANRPTATAPGLLAYLDAAEQVENGLAPAVGAPPPRSEGGVSVAHDRVQILTVHAAKGLEWQVVAVPHLSGRVFPSTASTRTWLTDAGDLPPLLRGDRATISEHGVPELDTSDVNDRKRLSDKISDHKRRLDQRRVDEERRLLYVALTRAENTLLLSGHHWGAAESKPRGPSEFLCELKEIIEESAAAGDPCGVVEQWAPAPADGEPNPLRDKVIEAVWPADPAGSHRGDVDRGATLVTQAISRGLDSAGRAGATNTPVLDADGWAADVDALLAERQRATQRPSPVLPAGLSVSTLVELGRDPDAAAQRLRRRLPTRPDPHALLGTAFHDWVQRFFHAQRLFDLDDLPGAVDGNAGHNQELADLQAAFALSPWAARTPVDVEVPFDMVIGGRVVRGRIDAIFADADGGSTVVDWKTGEPPDTPQANRHAAVQLAVYRLAWAALQGCPVESVRAAFHYVRTWRTVTPDSLPGVDDLAALLAAHAA
jgi:DNA helicase-2/ATP-dependent DNA helicase PcrA